MNPGPLIRRLLLREVRRADCRRRRVGAILVLNGVVVGKGSNSLPEGSCLDGDCPRGLLTHSQVPKDVEYEASGCVAIHAEDAALAEAGTRAVGAIAYISEWPCPRCEDRLKAAGVVGFIKVQM